jgi:hypothetical protein
VCWLFGRDIQRIKKRLKGGMEVEVDEAEVEVHGIVSFVKGYPTQHCYLSYL